MTATPEQVASIGKAGRDLLRFAWTREPRIDLMVTSGLIAVGRTFSTDPGASAALLREAIAPDHLSAHGYKELRWIAQEIKPIAQNDPSLAVDIYCAAFGYAETSEDSTNMGNSTLLALRSNRRQDYQGAWYLLSEAIAGILDDNLEAGVRAVVRSLHGYVERQQRYPADSPEGAQQSFAFGSFSANFQNDWSYSWYRSGYKPVQDAPVLLTKFEEFLNRLATQDGAPDKITRVLTTIVREPHVVAALWASLLDAGAKHPALYAARLLPLVCAHPVMLSSDTSYQLGNFIRAAYGTYSEADRKTIEREILSLPNEGAGKRAKSVLAGCIPGALISSAEMRDYIETLENTDGLRPNAPPMRITTAVREFDTDAYLEAEGVSLEEPESAALRQLMRAVEGLHRSDGGSDLSLSSVERQIDVLMSLLRALKAKSSEKVPATLFEHATGQMAEAAGRLARAEPSVLATPSVKRALKEILLFSSTSENPRYNAEHAVNFHEGVSWGGPSARTAAAHGLVDFTRASTRRDPQVMAAIHQLARDQMPEVRLQIVRNLSVLRLLDPQWIWSEIEYVLTNEEARGVVTGALDSLSRIAYLDIPRTIRAAKDVIHRYRDKNEPGMAECRSDAATLIFDLHIFDASQEADNFAAALIEATTENAEHIRHLVARYSDNLLVGSVDDPAAADNAPRRKVLVFYGVATERAFREIEDRAARLDLRNFSDWPDADQATVRNMFGILDEVSLRLHFATGNHHGIHSQPSDLSPQLIRVYHEAKPILSRLANAIVAPIAHHLIQTLEAFIPIDPAGVFALVALAVKSARQGGYSDESQAADLIVRIVERYLADYRAVFADRPRLDDLMDCLDIFARAGWPAAQALTFRLGEIWR
jgi:hypothetical protein